MNFSIFCDGCYDKVSIFEIGDNTILCRHCKNVLVWGSTSTKDKKSRIEIAKAI